jgi:hypothetical protein
MRMRPDGAWLPFRATQAFRADRPELSWRARVWMAGVLPVFVEDAYRDGHGRLDARLLGLFREPTEPRVRWVGRMRDDDLVGGCRIPTRGEVAWHLPEGELVYWRGEVTSLTRR